MMLYTDLLFNSICILGFSPLPFICIPVNYTKCNILPPLLVHSCAQLLCYWWLNGSINKVQSKILIKKKKHQNNWTLYKNNASLYDQSWHTLAPPFNAIPVWSRWVTLLWRRFLAGNPPSWTALQKFKEHIWVMISNKWWGHKKQHVQAEPSRSSVHDYRSNAPSELSALFKPANPSTPHSLLAAVTLHQCCICWSGSASPPPPPIHLQDLWLSVFSSSLLIIC